MDLNLSDSQRDQAIQITEKYQISRVKAMGILIKERDNLRAALKADEFNEETARQAFQKLSSIRENLFIERVKMMKEMKAILTPEQVKLWDERKAGRSDWSRKRAGCGGPITGSRSGESHRWSRDCPLYR